VGDIDEQAVQSIYSRLGSTGVKAIYTDLDFSPGMFEFESKGKKDRVIAFCYPLTEGSKSKQVACGFVLKSILSFHFYKLFRLHQQVSYVNLVGLAALKREPCLFFVLQSTRDLREITSSFGDLIKNYAEVISKIPDNDFEEIKASVGSVCKSNRVQTFQDLSVLFMMIHSFGVFDVTALEMIHDEVKKLTKNDMIGLHCFNREPIIVCSKQKMEADH
jgi:secreted Zn-dependent insulinase-like peptidase